MTHAWHPESWLKSTKSKAMDGLEEWARAPVLTMCKEQCPVREGTMRNSLGVERDDANMCVYIGGGGAAKDYIFRQHQDLALNHPTGKAKFISQPVQQLSNEIPSYIKKHVKD